MGLPNRDEVEGKFDRAKGTIKKGAGRVLDDPELENEGEVDETKGQIRENVGKVRRKVGEAIEDVGDKIAR
jgi:uncharacterized protein YjbJ (UPF0337 family)